MCSRKFRKFSVFVYKYIIIVFDRRMVLARLTSPPTTQPNDDTDWIDRMIYGGTEFYSSPPQVAKNLICTLLILSKIKCNII